MPRYTPGIRAKLIVIFILIKVLPLMALAWFAWDEIFKLAAVVENKSVLMMTRTRDVVKGVSDLATQNSIQALDIKSRQAIERLTTDTARSVAAFLYDRDRDIQLAAQLPVNKALYLKFIRSRFKPVMLHGEWVLDTQGEHWVPRKPTDTKNGQTITAQNKDNRRDFHYRPPFEGGTMENRPLYLEMTFVDLAGNEIIKVSTSDLLPKTLRNVSTPRNTYCRAETYFQALKKLQPGEIYVSEVIGPYVKGHIIGTYNRSKAEKMGIAFAPEKSGYAGKENPVGIRFQGLVRWGIPVVKNQKIIGYVTLALDHTHIMEFTDHIVPTEERYTAISDAGSGNYAFMWDYKGRNISHPRDYFIVGFDPQTGERAVPWLDEEMFELWRRNNESMTLFEQHAPQFKEQALSKKPAAELTRNGFLGLDGRYLNFAPQCTGWHNLTQEGGSGSFLIFWSGLWKLTTAAAIPYYTGIYGQHPRGFGYVTIGANVNEFHSAAEQTAKTIRGIEADFTDILAREKKESQALMHTTLHKAFRSLSLYTVLMIIVVIFIAIMMAETLTSRITSIVQGIRRFQQGDRGHRFVQQSKDEMGQLTQAFNAMADAVDKHIGELEISKSEIETVNTRLEKEISERRQAQDELSKHRDNLELLVKGRTQALEKEIAERKQMENERLQSQARLRRQNKTLLRLASHAALYGDDLEASVKAIIPTAGHTLQVERSSFWLLDDNGTHFVCKEMYIRSTNRHFNGERWLLSDFPIFISALQTSRTIAAADAFEDPALVEFTHEYLPMKKIRSMLVVGVYEGGKMAGIAAFGQTHEEHQWHLDEVNFANSIADMIGLSMGAAKRHQAVKEKEQLEARLVRVEKMEAIGTLAGGVAHDLNNILSGLVSYPELLLLQLPTDSHLRKPINTILKSGKRAATIVQDLLALARRGVAVNEVVHLNQIVDDFLQSPEYYKIISYHPYVRVEKQLELDLMNISGSPVHLTKALMNLVSNAAEAIPETGMITIATENCYIDRPVKGYDVVNEGDYVALSVTDTGTGISDEDLEHIFEPFYTKKKMGRSGTGLGMAVVWGTVKDHKGYIDFESHQGQGSRFTLYFPVTRKLQENKHRIAQESYMGQGETILVVDDVLEQREIATAILTTLGYQVHAVASGEAAIDYLRTRNADLMVLDMIMDPGMDGLDTYKQVLQIHPDQKAIIASGFSETDRIRQVQRLGASIYLRKPYTIENIGVAVQKALSS